MHHLLPQSPELSSSPSPNPTVPPSYPVREVKASSNVFCRATVGTFDRYQLSRPSPIHYLFTCHMFSHPRTHSILCISYTVIAFACRLAETRSPLGDLTRIVKDGMWASRVGSCRELCSQTDNTCTPRSQSLSPRETLCTGNVSMASSVINLSMAVPVSLQLSTAPISSPTTL